MQLTVEHITHHFNENQVLDDVSLTLSAHETVSVLGRSGCGKTTLLKIIAGILTPDRGQVYVDDANIHAMDPHKRQAVYLYQETLLFPHLSAFENIAFGLRVRGVNEAEINQRSRRMISDLALDGKGAQMPHELSGGQQQRVAFGRALIVNPKVLLLDEPFGNLDAETRTSMQQLFKKIAAEYHITALFVTHDLKEAIRMGNRIAVMEGGRLSLYDSIEAFVREADAGVREERKFWNTLVEESRK